MIHCEILRPCSLFDLMEFLFTHVQISYSQLFKKNTKNNFEVFSEYISPGWYSAPQMPPTWASLDFVLCPPNSAESSALPLLSPWVMVQEVPSL